MKLCPKCNTPHEKPGTFCSRKCANARIFSEASNKQRSLSVKIAVAAMSDEAKAQKYFLISKNKKYVGEYSPIEWRHCTNCNIEFLASPAKTRFTTCSDKCFIAVKRKNIAGKKTEFMGKMFDSLWEVNLAKWLIENQIEFEMPDESLKWVDSSGKIRKYFPDFYLPKLKLYVDPKNQYCIDQQKEKLIYLENNYNIIYGDLEALKMKIQTKFLALA